MLALYVRLLRLGMSLSRVLRNGLTRYRFALLVLAAAVGLTCGYNALVWLLLRDIRACQLRQEGYLAGLETASWCRRLSVRHSTYTLVLLSLICGDFLFLMMFWCFFCALFSCAGYVPSEPWRYPPRSDTAKQNALRATWLAQLQWIRAQGPELQWHAASSQFQQQRMQQPQQQLQPWRHTPSQSAPSPQTPFQNFRRSEDARVPPAEGGAISATTTFVKVEPAAVLNESVHLISNTHSLPHPPCPYPPSSLTYGDGEERRAAALLAAAPVSPPSVRTSRPCATDPKQLLSLKASQDASTGSEVTRTLSPVSCTSSTGHFSSNASPSSRTQMGPLVEIMKAPPIDASHYSPAVSSGAMPSQLTCSSAAPAPSTPLPPPSSPSSEAEGHYNAQEVHEYEANGSLRFCTFCDQYKPDGSHHCRVCHRCVLDMDHHCFFLNTCVGRYNYKLFFLALSYAVLSGMFSSVSMTLTYACSAACRSLAPWWWFCVPTGIMMVTAPITYLWLQHVFLLVRGVSTLERMREVSSERFLATFSSSPRAPRNPCGRCGEDCCLLLTDCSEAMRVWRGSAVAAILLRSTQLQRFPSSDGLLCPKPNSSDGEGDDAMELPDRTDSARASLTRAARRARRLDVLFGRPRLWVLHLLPIAPPADDQQRRTRQLRSLMFDVVG